MIDLKEDLLLSASDQRREQGSRSAVIIDSFLRCIRESKDKTARIGIIGLGYVGLPLARAFADKGYTVLGFDTDANKVERLAERRELYRPYPGRRRPSNAGSELRADRRFPSPRRTGRHHHLRPDAA